MRFHRTDKKKVHHPVVGCLDLDYEALEFLADPSLTMLVYTAPVGSPTADALKMLASWALSEEDEFRVDRHNCGPKSPSEANNSPF